MTKPTKVPGIPKPPSDVSAGLRGWLSSVAEALEIRLGRRGDPKDRAITLRELIDSGLAKELKAAPFDPNNPNPANLGLGPPTVIDSSVPPAPTSFTVAGAYSQVILSWDYPNYGNHSFSEIYGHSSDVIGDAQLIGVSTGRVYIDPIGSGASRYYWIRHVSTSSVLGPWNSGTGTLGQTATDVAHQLNVLSNAITSSQLATSLSEPIGKIDGLENFTGYSSSYSGNSLLTRMGAVETTANGAATSAQLSSEATTRANADSALASDITTLQASVGTNTSAISSEASTRASADTALSNSITTLTTSVGSNTTSISNQATSINGLEAQYSVKIDNNGHVSGFGLSSTTTTAGPTSAFIVRADKFAVIDPASTADGLGTTTPTAANVPFFIDSGTTYIKAAAIKDASITSAKIGSVNADTINAGTIDALHIGGNSIGASKLKLDSNVLTENASGELILKTVTVNDGVSGVKYENLSYDSVGVVAQMAMASGATLSNQSLNPEWFTSATPFTEAQDNYGYTYTLPVILTMTVDASELRESGDYYIDFGAHPFGSVSTSSQNSASMLVLQVSRKSPSASNYTYYADRATTASKLGILPLFPRFLSTTVYLQRTLDYQFKLHGHIKGFGNAAGSNTKGMTGGYIRIFRIHKAT